MNKLMRRPLPVALAVCALAVVVAAGCGGSSKKSSSSTTTSASGGGGKIEACALLPDTKSSTRYTLFDAPYLKEAFANANVPAQVLNALNDSQKQKSQAQQCLAKGAKVILLDQINASSGNAITNLAVGQGAKVIDYDRLVVGQQGRLLRLLRQRSRRQAAGPGARPGPEGRRHVQPASGRLGAERRHH